MTPRCRCGCARAVKPGNRYATPGCVFHHRQTAPEYAAWRAAREAASTRSRQERRHRQALARAERFPTKAAAYAAGARAGYSRAYRWWQAQVGRVLRCRRAS